MSAAVPASEPRVGVLDLVLCWTAGLVGYLLAEYGAGGLLLLAVDGDGALPSWTWLPWLAGPVACGLAAAAVLPLWRRPARWHWGVAGAAVPLLAAPVTWFVVAGSATAGLALDVAVQVVLAALVASGVGLLRTAVQPALVARRPAPVPPASYTS